MVNESASSSIVSHKLFTTDSRKITQICGNGFSVVFILFKFGIFFFLSKNHSGVLKKKKKDSSFKQNKTEKPKKQKNLSIKLNKSRSEFWLAGKVCLSLLAARVELGPPDCV